MESAAGAVRSSGASLESRWRKLVPAALGLPLWLLFSAAVWAVGGCTDRHTSVGSVVAPHIESAPASQAARAGAKATLKVVATGTAPLHYEWRRDGFVIEAATGPTYTTAPLTTADDGTSYVVVVSNAAGSVMSSEAQVSVAP